MKSQKVNINVSSFYGKSPILGGQQVKISTILRTIACQENCDGEEYDAMMLAAEALDKAEGALMFYADRENWVHPPLKMHQTMAISAGDIRFRAPTGKCLASALVDHGNIATRITAYDVGPEE